MNLRMTAMTILVFVLAGCGYSFEENVEGNPDATSDADDAVCVDGLLAQPDVLSLAPGDEVSVAISNTTLDPIVVVDIFMTGSEDFFFLENPITRPNVTEIVIPAEETLNVRVAMDPSAEVSSEGTLELECEDEDGTRGLLVVDMAGQ